MLDKGLSEFSTTSFVCIFPGDADRGSVSGDDGRQIL